MKAQLDKLKQSQKYFTLDHKTGDLKVSRAGLAKTTGRTLKH